MAIFGIPFAAHNSLSIQPTKKPTFHSFPTRNYQTLASTLAQFDNSSTTAKTHLPSARYSAQHTSFVQNVTLMLQSLDFTNPDACTEIYAFIFQKCKQLNNLELGSQLHAHLIVCGVELCAFLGSQLLELYCRLGCVNDARKVFEKMPERNVFSWTSMMGMYNVLGCYEEIVNLFYLMISEGVRPDHFVFPKVFKACSELKDFRVGKDVYDYMISIEFEGNACVKRALLDMFIKCGRMEIATELFEEIEYKDVVMWNMMVSGYASRGDFDKALTCVKDMKLDGVLPDQVTWNSIITGYAQSGRLKEASKWFSQMNDSKDFKPNLVSWTALIAGHEQNGYSSQALHLFKQMLNQGVKPNSRTIASVISACTNLSMLQHGKEIHGYCIKKDGLRSDLMVGNSLVDFYAKCQCLDAARLEFDKIKQKDLVSWNTMLAGYAVKGSYEDAIKLLNEMEIQGVEPDTVTWNGLITGFTQNGQGETALEFFYRMNQADMDLNITSISGALAACTQVKDLKLGKEIHGYVIRHCIQLSTGVGSALISMYAACSCLKNSFSIFSQLSTRDIVIWNSILAAFVQSGQVIDALNLLRHMIFSNVKPDTVTIVSVLPACSKLAALRQGKEIHQFIIRHGLSVGSFVWNALIDMYGRCGAIQKSRKVFDLVPRKDLVSWNVMISVYGMHGFGMDAVNLFRRLRAMGLKPNHVTFTNLLSACSHSGLLDEGWKYFEMMKKEYNMEPAMEQYCCMVDLMARAGQLDETLDFIKKMPFQPNSAVWGSLLGACRIHCNPDLAEYAAGYLLELEPQISGNYILLANVYAAAGRWEDAAKVRCLMKERGVTKSPGCSWIEVKAIVHSFIVGDTSHRLMDEILNKLESLYFEIKKIGYVPDTNYVLQNVEEAEKEFSLCGHSEKLALAFGLISTEAESPLRIIKNLRMCGDCHSATKYISKVEKREIIMRDNYSFHHFVNGACSCGDYW
ncbi:pentatricopeptide repeat-containing protein At4g21065-like [Pistacia vera]|uniref:pentatricopeptide repeat-containing protein At4g21065-like n=1 Tax=Pistacia vera TaxID=55513 RepID=UPI001263B648|nr:pentatricopeptide repeat-containing protein At4g21065-like [Pistacia vera]